MDKAKEKNKKLEREKNRENRQRLVISKQINYNNNWPKVSSLEIESAVTFMRRLADTGICQILSSVKLNINDAETLFMGNAKISKLFSTILDVHDLLPMHPDIAFDVTWRALEISMKYLSVESWKWAAETEFTKILRKACTDVFCPFAAKEKGVKEMWPKGDCPWQADAAA